MLQRGAVDQSLAGAVGDGGEGKHGNEEEAQQLQRGGNPVVDEVVDTAEDLGTAHGTTSAWIE